MTEIPPPNTESNGSLFTFLDESGNFDFSPTGTRFFVLTSVSLRRPFPAYRELGQLRYDLLEAGRDLELFHCAEDNAHVRRSVFERISQATQHMRIDALIVEKPKTIPTLRSELRFYPEMLGYLLRWALPRARTMSDRNIAVVTDSLPIKKHRRAMERGIRTTLSRQVPAGFSYDVFHHQSRSHLGLQIADYCSWAIFRKYERGDTKHYDTVEGAIKSEFEIFRSSSTTYY